MGWQCNRKKLFFGVAGYSHDASNREYPSFLLCTCMVSNDIGLKLLYTCAQSRINNILAASGINAMQLLPRNCRVFRATFVINNFQGSICFVNIVKGQKRCCQHYVPEKVVSCLFRLLTFVPYFRPCILRQCPATEPHHWTDDRNLGYCPCTELFYINIHCGHHGCIWK